MSEQRLDRRLVAAELLEGRGGLLVVAGLGAAAWDITAIGDHDLNFPLWGAMGGAAMLGLGLALARPDRQVLVITGDGEALMGLTSLSTIGASAAKNLGLAIFDNERYGETGMQATTTEVAPGRPGTDLAAVAAACGFPQTGTARTVDQVSPLVTMLRSGDGPTVGVFKISDDVPPQVVPPRDGPYLATRFRTALGL